MGYNSSLEQVISPLFSHNQLVYREIQGKTFHRKALQLYIKTNVVIFEMDSTVSFDSKINIV
jgi:hypothetical protein